ncbi:MAG: glycosyltransferase [Acetobacterium sp.]|nr:glycosyltransferase [Bacillota bacterium]MCG2730815.1 glycosyltransferase [Acetobacterium sp.]
MIIVFGTILLGLLVSRILFHRFAKLDEADSVSVIGDDQGHKTIRLSIIIPARNEEKNLSLLLNDLKKQTAAIHEIICVDDGSTDQTAKIAMEAEAMLITSTQKPPGWIGKSWACQLGGEAATGAVLLFLDADVRLSPAGIGKLLTTYKQTGSVVSVMPYHQIEKKAETLSLFFNLLQMGANGMGLPVSHNKNSKPGENKKNKAIGLYGPVILISHNDYQAVGGHAAIKDSIVDDMALGEKLQEKAIPFALFLGDQDVSYRMYSGGLKDLVQGWTKNQAAGAAKTPVYLIFLVFFWITSCASIPVYLMLNLIWQHWLWVEILAACYGVWVLELIRIARHIGSFSVGSIVFYPVSLIFYLVIFLRSMIKKILGLPVIWKDREIRLEK